MVNEPTWAERLSPLVPGWIAPFAEFYRKRGFDREDLAQEIKLFLVTKEDYLRDTFAAKGESHLKNLAKLMSLRALRRKLLSRSMKSKHWFADSPEDKLEGVQAREERLITQMAIAEMIDTAPVRVKAYLLKVMKGEMVENESAATDQVVLSYVSQWIATYSWRHES